MSQLKALTFAPLPRPALSDPVMARRAKLIMRLEQQVALVEDPSFRIKAHHWFVDESGVKQLRERTKRVQPWWRTDASGSVILTVRYGARVIEFEKGKSAIVVGTRDQLVPTINNVIGAVKSGELDQLLGQMSKQAVLNKRKKAA